MSDVNKILPQNDKGNIATESNEEEEFEKRWFCVAIQNDGSVFMDDADSPAGIMDILENASIAWIDFRTGHRNFQKDALDAAMNLGFSEQLISTLNDQPRLLYEDRDTEIGLKLPSIQIRVYDHTDVQSYTTLLFMKKNFILTIHPLHVDRRFGRLRRYSNRVLMKIPAQLSSQDKLTLLLMRIIDQNNDRNFEHLRQIEEEGDELNKRLMDPKTPRDLLGPQIYGMKHALITYLNALWETVDVIHDIRYGDADLLTDDPNILARVGLLAEDVSSQIGLAEHMSEVLASGLEVLQSIYNNQLQLMNNRLSLVITYLTVIGTAILVPNTLATVLGNSAFDMGPEDAAWYLALLIVSTIVSTYAVFWWVKKSGWLPKKID